jgi:hypothetical protein
MQQLLPLMTKIVMHHATIVTLMAKIVMHHATIVAFDDKCMTMGVVGGGGGG